LHMSIAMPLR